MPGDDPGQRERQQQQERDRLAAEEAEAVDRERRPWPSTSATAVAIRPTLTDSQSELRTSGSFQAAWNQCSVQPEIGQVWMPSR